MAGDTAFAPGLQRLLRQATGIGQRRAELADATLRTYAGKLERRLDALLHIAPRNQPGGRLQAVIKKAR